MSDGRRPKKVDGCRHSWWLIICDISIVGLWVGSDVASILVVYAACISGSKDEDIMHL
jgi:hypothetical protein